MYVVDLKFNNLLLWLTICIQILWSDLNTSHNYMFIHTQKMCHSLGKIHR